MLLRSFTAAVLALTQTVLLAQQQTPQPALPPGFVRAPAQSPPSTPGLSIPQAAPPRPVQAQPGGGAAKPQGAQPTAPMPTLPPPPAGSLTLQNASLREVIDLLARQLKIN